MSLDYPYDAGFDLRRCNYPNLQIFGTTQPLTVSVAEFLNRHPTITRLTLATPPWNGSTGLPKICLPRLNEVSMVPSSLIPNLSFNCHVESIRLFWICTEDVCDAHFKAIAQSRSPVLRVSITFAAWQPAVITALFRHIAPSRVHGLMMSHIGRPSAPSEEEFLHTLGVALKESRPPNLSQLMCQCLKYGVVNVATYDRDFAFMREWGEILPGLAGCILPAGVTWFRLRGPAWIPDMSLPLSKRWLFKMLRERQYPFVELITPLLRVYRKSQGTYDPLGIKNLRVIKPDSALFLENAFDPDELADDEEYLYQEGDELDDDGDPKIRALMEQDGVHLEDFYRYED
ncbi:hypothetical protein HYDPIDRAFT_22924 [Hydnomerulius pinastri MD-312]|nr:hypothetical protein HYDPIDRAFT_22924 [Hydnomerulius pinastri MD-312]